MKLPALAVLIATAFTAEVAAQSIDTIFAEVGHSAIDGRLMKPHAARVRVYRGDTLTSQWLNELTIGDSAGQPIMRWVTTSEPVPGFPGRVLSVLRQTYNARTLAPLGYSTTASNGAFVRVAIDGRFVTGTRRTAVDTTTIRVRDPIPRLGFFAGASDLVPIAAGLRHGSVMVAPVWNPLNAGMTEDRVFTVRGDTAVMVEGRLVRSTQVEEWRRTNGTLYATWYLLLESPYMVYGELPLPDGRVQRITEVEVPPRKP
ncbi:MAG: hypothetical protein KF709_08730 [Gemmatimonadaceae bacterium]|nr:hypothetical protein [Gemmatimonadaceae bacterium]